MKNGFNKGSCNLPELTIGDRVKTENQTTLRKIRWDKTRVMTSMLCDRQYEILVDGIHHISLRIRRHLRKIEAPKPEVVLEEDKDRSRRKSENLQQLQKPEKFQKLHHFQTLQNLQAFQKLLQLQKLQGEVPGHRVYLKD